MPRCAGDRRAAGAAQVEQLHLLVLQEDGGDACGGAGVGQQVYSREG